MKKIWQVACMASNVKCKVCNGWGGDWGLANNGRAICYDCWQKGNR